MEQFMRLFLATAVALCVAAAAQAETKGQTDLRLTAGYAGFIDEDLVDHAAIGSSLRYYLTPRLAIEPEVLFLIGPGNDRNWVIMPNVAFDLRRSGRAIPYVSGGAGLLHYRDQLSAGPPIATNSWTASGGAGVKLFLTERVFVAPEFRLGTEPLMRLTASIGYVWKR